MRPFALFVSEPIVQLLGVYMAFVYGLIYRAWSFPPFLPPRLACVLNSTPAAYSVDHDDAVHIPGHLRRVRGHRGAELYRARPRAVGRLADQRAHDGQGLRDAEEAQRGRRETGVSTA